MKYFQKYLLLISLHLLYLPLVSQTPCECTNCPVPIYDTSTFKGYLEVFVNGPNDLTQCPLEEVCFTFSHTWIGDLSVSLISPNGTNYLIMADQNNAYGGCGIGSEDVDVCITLGTGNPLTNNTQYQCNGPDPPCLIGDWTVPCGGVTDPVSGAIQAPNCNLNDFNQAAAPANGTWTLVVNDLCHLDSGFIENWSLRFGCDVLDCFDCVAEGGIVVNPHVTACKGSPELDPNWTVDYGAQGPPDPTLYSYTYFVANSSGTIIAINEDPELSGYPPGIYTICGFSYYTFFEPEVNSYLNGDLATIQSSFTPGSEPFCGEFSDNCVTFVVGSQPSPTNEEIEICVNDCITLPGGTVCCEPDQSCQEIFTTPESCDSVVNYTVIPLGPYTGSENYEICPGECITYNSQSYCAPGEYEVTLSSLQGCDSIITLTISEVDVFADIVSSGNLTCADTIVTIQSGPNTTADLLEWYDQTNNLIGTGTFIQVNSAGCYTLRAISMGNNITCSHDSTICIIEESFESPAPVIAGSIKGCVGQQQVYTINSDPLIDNYTWYVSPPAFIVSGQNTTTLTVDWNGASGADVCVYGTSEECGDSDTACISVTIGDIPPVPSITSSPPSVCLNEMVMVCASQAPAIEDYFWSVNGGTITGSTNDSCIGIIVNTTTSLQICTGAENNCGSSDTTCIEIPVLPSFQAPPVTGANEICNDSITFFSVPPVAGVISYEWMISDDCAQIIQGQGTTNILIDWSGCDSDIYSVCLELTDDCASQTTCADITVNEVPSPDAGPDRRVCTMSSFLNVMNVIGAGEWSYFGPGNAFIQDVTDPGTGVTVDSPGVYTFYWNENNGNCAGADTVNITFTTDPTVLQVSEDCDSTATSYTVTFHILSGTPPFNINGSHSGTLNGNIFTSEPIPSGDAYSFTVTGIYGCFLLIQGEKTCDCITNAGTMADTIFLTACSGDSVIATHHMNAVFDPNDTAQFYLHDASGGVLGNIIDSSSTGVFTDPPGINFGQTYYISYGVGTDKGNGLPDTSDPCFDLALGQPVIWYQNPDPNAGPDKRVCGLEAMIQVTNSIAGGNWVYSTTGGGTAVFSLPSSPSTEVMVTQPGFYTFSWTEINSLCMGSDSVTLEFLSVPEITDVIDSCNSTSNGFYVLFTITGGTPPFSISGSHSGSLNGNVFTSEEIASGSNYTFTVEDSNGCYSEPFIDNFACNCITDAGTMSPNLLEVCGGSLANGIHNGDTTLDQNDVTYYYLHDGSGGVLGSISDSNATGVFSFLPGMIYGRTYYITLGAGDDNGLGIPDRYDPCFDLAHGQPVSWVEPPFPDLGPDVDTCADEMTLIVNSPGSNGTWILPDTNILSISPPNSPAAILSADTAGIYPVVWEGYKDGCVGHDTIVISFGASPVIYNVTIDSCQTNSSGYILSFDIKGGIKPYASTGTPGSIIEDRFTSNLILSGESYSITVNDAVGCPSTTLAGDHLCDCITDAGTMPQDTLIVCENQVLNTANLEDEVLDDNDTLTYILHRGRHEILIGIIDTSTDGSFTFKPGMQYGITYYISSVAGNVVNDTLPDPADPCFDVGKGQPVVWYPNPSVDVGPDTSICGFRSILFAQGNSGYWTGTGPGNFEFADSTSNLTAVTVVSPGVYYFTFNSSQNGCTSRDTVRTQFLAPPEFVNPPQIICDLLMESYRVSFEVAGSSPFTVDGNISGSFIGNVFTSDPISSGDSYELKIYDRFGCGPLTYIDSAICECVTDAGRMDSFLMTECVGDTIEASTSRGYFLDSNDVLAYILHDLDSTETGKIYAINSNPRFGFVTGMKAGETYYISAVAGNDIGTLLPDTLDPCFDVAEGTPVIWNKLPDLTLEADTSVCRGETVVLEWQLTGRPEFRVIINGSTRTFNSKELSEFIPVYTDTTLHITAILDKNLCLRFLDDTTEIEVGQPAKANLPDTVEICNSEDLGSTYLNLIDLIYTGDTTGEWIAVNGLPGGISGVIPDLDFTGVDPGIYLFRYTTSAAEDPCPQREYYVNVKVNDCDCPDLEVTPPEDLCNLNGQLDLNEIIFSEIDGHWEWKGTPAGDTLVLTEHFDAQGVVPGIYTFFYYLDSAVKSGCPDSARAIIEVQEYLSAGERGDSITLCFGTDTMIDLSELIVNINEGGKWSDHPDNPNTIGSFNPDKGVFNIRFQESGNYEFLYTMQPAEPCPPDQITVGVRILKVPIADAGPDQTIDCIDSITTIGSKHQNFPDNTYMWIHNGTDTVGDMAEITIDQPGIYEIIVSDKFTKCTNTDIVEVEGSVEMPEGDIVIEPVSCYGENDGAVIIDSVMNGDPPYQYSLNGSPYSILNIFEPLSPGEYLLEIKDASHCIQKTNILITEPEPLNVSLEADAINHTIRLGDSIYLMAHTSVAPEELDTVFWDPDQYISCDSCLNTWVSPPSTLRYTVFVEKDGCRQFADLNVLVDREADIFVPNAFTPGDDGINDYFTVYTSERINLIHSLQVMDRWGNRVFIAENIAPNQPELGWDGTFMGKYLNPAVFTWIAEVEYDNGIIERYEGDVMILR